MGAEADRNMTLYCESGETGLLVRHFRGGERLGACFEYELELYCKKPDIKAEDLLGEHAGVKMRTGDQPERYFDGIVCEFGLTGGEGEYFTYRMLLRPSLWLLSRRTDCRIFQSKSTLDIVRDVFSRWDLPDLEVHVEHSPTRDYCVQYNESDLAFVLRLLEDDGVYFFFKHAQGRHTLVLTDSGAVHQPVKGFERLSYRTIQDKDPSGKASVHSWLMNTAVRSGKVDQVDYDFRKPRADLTTKQSAPKEHKHADAERFEYPGHYLEVDHGQSRAKVRLEEIQASYEIAEGDTDASGLFAGALFTLQDHKRTALNHEYLITAAYYDADAGPYESSQRIPPTFKVHVEAIDSKVSFRTPRTTRPPRISGAQTATVVGPKGREIWTDSYGRVKVHFHWDRAGKSDETSSCWIRVAQLWTGTNWGSLHIPRIGQEVVVEFLEGNPDRPLVTGCVYNDSNRPPYELPSKQTQSGIKSRSTEHGGLSDYNELRFDDDKGKEQLVIQAQRDMSTTVKADATISVGHDEKHTVSNNLNLEVSQGAFRTDVDKGPMEISVHQDNYSVQAKQILEQAMEKITLTVGPCEVTIDLTQIKLSMGGSSVVVDATGVTVTGAMVKMNS